MYIPSHFAADDATVHELLARHGAADLITVTEEGLLATMLPFVYEQAAGQRKPRIVGLVYGDADAAAAQANLAAARQAERQQTDPSYRSWVETKTLTARVADLVHSEAGMATLMDRKVNRGGIQAGVSNAAAALMREHRLTRLTDVAKYERALIQRMKYRGDFLADRTLTRDVLD